MNGDIPLALFIGFVVGYLVGLIRAYSTSLPPGHQPRATDDSPTKPPRPGKKPAGWRPVDRYRAPPPPSKDD